MAEYYLDVNNQIYGGDRGQRADGTLDPIAPDRPSPQHQWNGSAWVLTVQADWDAFRTSMIGDSTYQQIAVSVMATAQGNWLATTLQDVVSMPVPSIALLQPLWNQMMDLAPIKPVAADVARWQANADNTGVGLKFLASGAIG